MSELFNTKSAFDIVKQVQKEAISDKVKVGAMVVGTNAKGVERFFSGANLHVSDSFADIHAEQLAINLCLLERVYPKILYVTSQSFVEDVVLCGSCRHYISEINRDCRIIVFNPDGTIKRNVILSTVYPYSKDTEKKNHAFKKLCRR